MTDKENNKEGYFKGTEVSLLRHQHHKERQDRLEKEVERIKSIVDDLASLARYYKGAAKDIRSDVDELHETTKLILNLVHAHVAEEQQNHLKRTKLILKLIAFAGAVIVMLEAIHYAVTGETVSAAIVRDILTTNGL